MLVTSITILVWTKITDIWYKNSCYRRIIRNHTRSAGSALKYTMMVERDLLCRIYCPYVHNTNEMKFSGWFPNGF